MRELKVFRCDHLGYTWCQMCMWKGNPGKCDETFASVPDYHLGYEDKCDGCEKPTEDWQDMACPSQIQWPEGCINKFIEQWGEPLRRQGFSEKNIYKEWWKKHYGEKNLDMREVINELREKADG